MSIFSAFEALCAETFYCQKVALPLTPPPSININKQDLAVKIEDLKKGKEVTSQQEDRRSIRAPRFAPELDEVYCFETFLPY
ncbi:hypothetical protein PHJA_000162500 [Phtheirospermum japonicum]|uniref:Uncharacterized protein n=1 Tax=Phtheirospermum japonicum TaxID=374723 RepID=A0A830BDM8_9LAMI|nr:hypothetical protein PHJA_000162500 [Phtheirospermum japonicum]